MNTTDSLTVADLASRAYAQLEADGEARGDEMFEQQREEFLAFARGKARSVLGEEAAARLDWRYPGTFDLPTGVEQATASLGEGRSEYLQYRVTDVDEVTFALVQPCGTCGRNQIDGVRDLAHLGGLLEAAADLAKIAKGGADRG
ncbi:hypothetical protein [Streptomyces noursei]|uniref:hypothetical protein n=1 Tax=Streptomyces noursei TaxID=1971 RepID=UPI00167B64B5|nr:hypothetical protein [Streptomyces noursei]MCZ1014040.1 hypothetical protein [Streptomyces noursei]GGX49379.1 hypothetical protein GCM10010341_83810 [Streptomyces noursei]